MEVEHGQIREETSTSSFDIAYIHQEIGDHGSPALTYPPFLCFKSAKLIGPTEIRLGMSFVSNGWNMFQWDGAL